MFLAVMKTDVYETEILALIPSCRTCIIWCGWIKIFENMPIMGLVGLPIDNMVSYGILK
jgi:hypothetical protein